MEEKQFLSPLPDILFEVFTISKGHVVGLNCHVQYKKNYYSVPYTYARDLVDLKINENAVDIFSGNERIASHRRFPDYINYKYSTDPAHMPDKFNNQEWDDVRIKKWADSIGTSTRKVIDKIFDSCQIEKWPASNIRSSRPSFRVIFTLADMKRVTGILETFIRA